MITVIDGRLVFGRDQVVTRARVAKDFDEMLRRAQAGPLLVPGGDGGADAVLVGYDEFEAMALELVRLRGLVLSPPVPLSAAEVGCTVEFGSYRQGAGESEGPEPIKWLVLDIRGGRALLLSWFALDSTSYSEGFEDVTWEECSLRSWLNGEFLETAFSEGERALVARTELPDPDNKRCGTTGGRATVDSVFLLGVDEAERYFSTDADRVCLATGYAVAQGAFTDDEGGEACPWWLRPQGGDSVYTAYVCSDGSVRSDDWIGAYDGNVAVRPALWVNL